MATEKQERAVTKPFAQWLQEQRRGGLHGELSDALADVTQAAVEHRKQGTITLTLKIKPTGDGIVQVFDGVKINAPQGDRSPSVFYADDEGNLMREDPRQQKLELRTVARPEDEAEDSARKAV